MKKIASLILVFIFAFAFASCSEKVKENKETEMFSTSMSAKKESKTTKIEKESESTTKSNGETSSSSSKAVVTTKNSAKSTTKSSLTTKPAKTTTKKTTTTKKNTVTCKITIECADILDNMNDLAEGHEKYIVNSGYLVSNLTVNEKNGATVYDVLKKVCSNKNYYINQKSSYGGVYIAGINQIDEFDCGKESGWTYSVNGVNPPVSCNKYTLKNGDNVVFHYTCSFK